MSTTISDISVTEQCSPSRALQFKGFDYIELYVGNAHQAAHFYRTAFGFTPIAYAGLETGVRDRTSYVVKQGDIFLMLTSALGPESRIAEHVKLHGDGIKDVALTVPDSVYAFEETVKRGARPIMEPTVYEDEEGYIIKSTVAAFGDTVHSFIHRENYEGNFFPRFLPINHPLDTRPTGLLAIDHVAVSVERETLESWVEFYQSVMDFHPSHEEDVSTEYSAMNSKVVQNDRGSVIFPLVEPAPAKRKSQIEEHLEFYRGPGVQHIAFSSDDIYSTIRLLRANGNQFLSTPDSYYDMLEDRLGRLDESLAELRELNILVDRDRWGYLMQVFTKPLQGRPTVFLEILQRKEARGFGGGNIKALFEANEREQAVRGNL
jgi:4-hydroxyphenylpyruvate dioxygenase